MPYFIRLGIVSFIIWVVLIFGYRTVHANSDVSKQDVVEEVIRRTYVENVENSSNLRVKIKSLVDSGKITLDEAIVASLSVGFKEGNPGNGSPFNFINVLCKWDTNCIYVEPANTPLPERHPGPNIGGAVSSVMKITGDAMVAMGKNQKQSYEIQDKNYRTVGYLQEE